MSYKFQESKLAGFRLRAEGDGLYVLGNGMTLILR